MRPQQPQTAKLKELIWRMESNILESQPQYRMANVLEHLLKCQNMMFWSIQGLHTVEAENGGCQFTPWPLTLLTSNFQELYLT